MDPRWSTSAPCWQSFPRARGDGPAANRQYFGTSLLPPRSRGWTRLRPDPVDPLRASPALAGMDLQGNCVDVRRSGFPRARGDGPHTIPRLASTFALPPRSRGWTRRGRRPLPGGRASPALAGMDLGNLAAWLLAMGFPRARGDGPEYEAAASNGKVLPPRSRGWTRPRGGCPAARAASPALAGMDPHCSVRRSWKFSFPRARGDGPGRPARPHPHLPLPPRSRGWTLSERVRQVLSDASPALAGMDPCRQSPTPPRPCFPRARGDGPPWNRPRPDGHLLPPRSRGWTPALRARQEAGEASPALAGMDLDALRGSSLRPRFPRARGDGPGGGIRTDRTVMLPPRSRGWTPGGIQ